MDYDMIVPDLKGVKTRKTAEPNDAGIEHTASPEEVNEVAEKDSEKEQVDE